MKKTKSFSLFTLSIALLSISSLHAQPAEEGGSPDALQTVSATRDEQTVTNAKMVSKVLNLLLSELPPAPPAPRGSAPRSSNARPRLEDIKQTADEVVEGKSMDVEDAKLINKVANDIITSKSITISTDTHKLTFMLNQNALDQFESNEVIGLPLLKSFSIQDRRSEFREVGIAPPRTDRSAPSRRQSAFDATTQKGN
jgi:hypothetical protein